MTPRLRPAMLFWAGLLLSAALGSCASREPLPNFYVLTPAETVVPAKNHPRGARVFLRRVTLPGYLLPTKIASRRSESQIEYSSTALWAEGLQAAFGRALADALSRQPGVGAVSVPPLAVSPSCEYDLAIEVERFEGDDHGEVVLAARWQLYRPQSATPLLSRESRLVQPGWTYGDAAGQARLLGADVQELAAEIARAVAR